MPDQQLVQRCAAKIKSLPVPDPFDLEQFRINLEERRRRVLRLIPVQTSPACSGLWIPLPDSDCIFYERDTTRLHQLHIIAHETGHMVFGHRGERLGDGELAGLLFPHLDPDMVRSALARSGYTDCEEQEAETFASLLLDRITIPGADGLTPEKAGLLHHRHHLPAAVHCYLGHHQNGQLRLRHRGPSHHGHRLHRQDDRRYQ